MPKIIKLLIKKSLRLNESINFEMLTNFKRDLTL